MRREIWLAVLAGMVVGSWLTLIGVQFEIGGWIGAAQPKATQTAPAAPPSPPAAQPPATQASAPVAPPSVSAPKPADAPAVSSAQPAAAPAVAPSEVAKAEPPVAAAKADSPAASPDTAPAAPTAAAPTVTAAMSSSDTAASPAKPGSAASTAVAAQEPAGPSKASQLPEQAADKHAGGKPAATVASGNNPPEKHAVQSAPQISSSTPTVAAADAATSIRQHSAASKPVFVAIPIPRPESPSEIAAEHVVTASLGHPGKDEIHIEPINSADAGRLGADAAKTPGTASAPTPAPAPILEAQQSPALQSSPATQSPPAAPPSADASQAAAPSSSPVSSTPSPAPAPSTAAAASTSVETEKELADAAKKSDRQPAAPAATPDENSPAAGTPDTPASGTAQAQTKTVQLIHPFSDRAGVLTIGGRNIQLSGVIPMDTSRVCTDAAGKSWPCGVLARTALRMFLRGRTVDCDMPEPPKQDGVVASCRYAKTDLSDWLVRSGWAEPANDSSLADANREAREEKRGIYGSDPRKGGKSTLGPALPTENPLNPI